MSCKCLTLWELHVTTQNIPHFSAASFFICNLICARTLISATHNHLIKHQENAHNYLPFFVSLALVGLKTPTHTVEHPQCLGQINWFNFLYFLKRQSHNIPKPHTPNICLRSGSRNRKGMFETCRRLGVPLASVGSPAEPAAPVLHCKPASPWEVSSVLPCAETEENDYVWS